VSDDPEAGFREAESALYERYGLPHSEHVVRIPEPGQSIRVVEIGEDGSLPPVLLLHGIASVTAAAIPLIPQLGARRVLAVDWPGHGLSDPIDVGPRTDLRAHAVAVIDAVLDAFAVEEADIVAHSLGGQFALYYSLASPGRVRRLVLLGAPGAGFAGVRPMPAMRLMATPGMGRMILALPTSRAAYLKNSDGMLGAGALDGYPEQIAEAGYLASRRPGFAPSLAGFFRALITPFSVRSGVAVPLERLATLRTPTLMVWGDQDAFLTPEHGRASIDAIPGARLLLVEGGHAPWLDELELTGSTVRAFLPA